MAVGEGGGGGFAGEASSRRAALNLPETGLLFFFAIGAATELSVFMAGWSSRNKYSLLGAMRGSPIQMSVAPDSRTTAAIFVAAPPW